MASIDTLILANHAEALNGLLYISGGGWTDLWRGERPEAAPPPINHFGIGVMILVGWNETNRPHHLVLRIESEDGGTPLPSIEADLNVGRPPGLAPGSDQYATLAISGEVQFPAPGGYRLVAELAGQVVTRSFRVHDRPIPG